MMGLHNNGLHQTGRGGAVASRPVVEARPAGEAGCSTGSAGPTFPDCPPSKRMLLLAERPSSPRPATTAASERERHGRPGQARDQRGQAKGQAARCGASQ